MWSLIAMLVQFAERQSVMDDADGGVRLVPQCPAWAVDPAVINWVFLRRYTAGEIDLEAEILGLFLFDLSTRFESLQQARSGRDWVFSAHTILGSALAVGAHRLACVAQRAEELGDGLHQGRGMIIAEMEREIAAVQREIAMAQADGVGHR
jgi:HPt (histidine-containing phosphotransfer) domain-containing protein